MYNGTNDRICRQYVDCRKLSFVSFFIHLIIKSKCKLGINELQYEITATFTFIQNRVSRQITQTFSDK